MLHKAITATGSNLQGIPNLIASGQKLGVTIQLLGMSLVGIQLPVGMTSTALTFNVSNDGVTFVPLKSLITGTALSYTIGATAAYQAIDPSVFAGVSFLQIAVGTNEGADRTLLLSLKGI